MPASVGETKVEAEQRPGKLGFVRRRVCHGQSPPDGHGFLRGSQRLA